MGTTDHPARHGAKPEKNSFRNAVSFIALLTVVVAVASYLFFYYIFAGFTREKASSTNRQITESLTYAISEMDSSIRNLCVSQYFENDIQYLMNVTDPDIMTIQQTITRLKSSAASNLNIHSIAVFNNRTGILYSTTRGITDSDNEMKEIILDPDSKQLTPIPRVIPVSDYYSATPVFSYFLCDGSSDTRIDSALVVNLHADWLRQKLRSMSPSDAEHLVVFDGQYHVLADSRAAVTDFDRSAPNYCRDIIDDPSTQIMKIDGEKNYVAVSPIGGTGWYLLREVPCQTMLQEFYSLELTLLVFTVTIIILSVFLSFVIVRKIYAPIEQVADFLQEKTNIQTTEKRPDALSFISRTVQSIDENMQTLRKNSDQILRDNTLRLLFAGDPSVRNSEKNAAVIGEIDGALRHSGICLIRVPFSSLFSEVTPEQRISAACDISQAIQRFMPADESLGIISTSADERVILVPEGCPSGEVAAHFEELNGYLKNRYQITVSCFYESEREPDRTAHQRFVMVQKISQYRVFYSPGCFLDSSILAREGAPLTYPAEQVQSVVTSIKRNDSRTALSQYAQFSETVRGANNYDGYQLCIMQLFLSLKMLESELSSYAVGTARGNNMDEVYCALNSAEFYPQIDAVFEALIVKMSEPACDLNDKHSVLLESVREYIGTHYNDKELTPKQIAADFNISYAYFGRLFREYYGQSVKEYITTVRLNVAADCLASGSMSIKKIMDITGFDNESNFFRLFRTRYGITPNNYRLNQSISKNQNQQTEAE